MSVRCPKVRSTFFTIYNVSTIKHTTRPWWSPARLPARYVLQKICSQWNRAPDSAGPIGAYYEVSMHRAIRSVLAACYNNSPTVKHPANTQFKRCHITLTHSANAYNALRGSTMIHTKDHWMDTHKHCTVVQCCTDCTVVILLILRYWLRSNLPR